MSAFNLQGRTALVTGGARGLGAAMARALVRDGASVMIGDVRVDEGRQTARELGADGGRVVFIELDVTDEAQWLVAANAMLEEFGGFDILINNAGIEESALLVDLDTDALRRMLDVNIVGTALGLKHAFRVMRPGGEAGKGGDRKSVV